MTDPMKDPFIIGHERHAAVFMFQQTENIQASRVTRAIRLRAPAVQGL